MIERAHDSHLMIVQTQSAAAAYRDEIDEDLLCIHVQQVTHDVKSFVLRPRDGAWLRFQPGQYLTLSVRVDGEQLSRCYTIASSPLWPDALTITVKHVPGGPVSGWLHHHLQVGDTVRATGPLGVFSTDNHPAEKYLFLSAGSGITPLMSMTRTLHACGSPADVIFVHSARTPSDIIFRDELRELDANNATLRVNVVCEHDAADETWTGLRGRLTLSMLLTIAPDLIEREIFTCGPAPYMESVRDLLAKADVDPSRCHEESFVLAIPTLSVEPEAASTSTRSVELVRSGRVFACDEGMTILAAAARAGLTLPSSCAEGVCGTCKSTLLSGSVDMTPAGGIRPREIAANKILLCCSIPREDVVIDA